MWSIELPALTLLGANEWEKLISRFHPYRTKNLKRELFQPFIFYFQCQQIKTLRALWPFADWIGRVDPSIGQILEIWRIFFLFVGFLHYNTEKNTLIRNTFKSILIIFNVILFQNWAVFPWLKIYSLIFFALYYFSGTTKTCWFNMNHTLWHKSLIIVILLFFLLCTSCEHATRKDFLNPDFATSTSPLFSVWDDYCIDGMSDECCLQDDEHKKLEPKNMISTCYCNYTSKSCYSTIEWTANG